jgi:hypothetical protein
MAKGQQGSEEKEKGTKISGFPRGMMSLKNPTSRGFMFPALGLHFKRTSHKISFFVAAKEAATVSSSPSQAFT